jgi:GT2 family glycosyltransferase
MGVVPGLGDGPGRMDRALRCAAMPFVSIVIVHWQDDSRLMRCVASLRRDLDRAQDGVDPLPRSEVELILVENGEEGRAPVSVLESWPEIVRVRLPENVGFAAGANAGIARASGEWVELLNDDVRVCSGFHATLASAAEVVDGQCGMLQPCLLRGDEAELIDSTGVVVTRSGLIADRQAGLVASSAEKEVGEVFCASAGAAWYRRSMLSSMRPVGRVFDPGYFMYFEDVDLGWRCRLGGWSARYVPEAVAHHEGHASAAAHGTDFVRAQCMRNRARVFLANASPGLLWAVLPRLVRDAAGLIARRGFAGLREFIGSVRAGLSARRALPQVARRARSGVERAWILDA